MNPQEYAAWRASELKNRIHLGHRDQNIDAYKCPLCVHNLEDPVMLS